MTARLIAVVGTLLLAMVGPFSFTQLGEQLKADPNPALNNPDKFAWDLFTQLNCPALPGKRGIPDPSKKPGDPGQRLWETWKITTPIGSEVFLERGQRPGPWA